MMTEHLSAEDYLKYLDTAEESREYLLWMEPVQAHLEQCEVCRKLLQRAVLADSLEERTVGVALRFLEEELRQGVVRHEERKRRTDMEG